jgi:hypothetical protein
MWTKGQGVQAADAAIGSYQSQIAELESERRAVASDHGVVQNELRDALARAAQVLLPDASPATLHAAAAELGGPWLLARRRDMENNRVAWAQRLTEIERDPRFVRRHALLNAARGELAVEQASLREAIAGLESQLSRLQTETFQWIRNRETARELERGALGSFWDAVTFAGYREEKAKKRCAAELGFATYEEVMAVHHDADTRLRHAQHRCQQIDAERAAVLALLDEHAKLYGWTHDFEARLCEMLRGEVVAAVSRGDLGAVHRAIRPEARSAIAQAHALAKKADYLVNLGQFLDNQIADRQARIGPIRKTRVAWSMKPWDRVSGNKSKWLVGLPQSKKESTHKQVRWVRRMHHNIVVFEDYDDYDYYLWHNPGFLPYDAFAYASDEPMPYEGFSRGIIGDLATHRAHHGQDRADYKSFRDLDKAAEAEERAASATHEIHRYSSDRSDEIEHQGTGEADIPYQGTGETDVHDSGDGGSDGGDDFSEAEAGLSTDDAGGDASDVS